MQISNARATDVPGRYDVTVIPDDGDPFDYTVAPDDPAPLAEAIRKTVEEQAIEIGPYVAPPPPEVDPNAPPTLEERLAVLEEKAARVDKLEAVLIQKGTVSADAIDAVAVEPAIMGKKA